MFISLNITNALLIILISAIHRHLTVVCGSNVNTSLLGFILISHLFTRKTTLFYTFCLLNYKVGAQNCDLTVIGVHFMVYPTTVY